MTFFDSIAYVRERYVDFAILRGEGGGRSSIKAGKTLEKFETITEVFGSFADEIKKDVRTEL
jgi:hypothetical protein